MTQRVVLCVTREIRQRFTTTVPRSSHTRMHVCIHTPHTCTCTHTHTHTHTVTHNHTPHTAPHAPDSSMNVSVTFSVPRIPRDLPWSWYLKCVTVAAVTIRQRQTARMPGRGRRRSSITRERLRLAAQLHHRESFTEK